MSTSFILPQTPPSYSHPSNLLLHSGMVDTLTVNLYISSKMSRLTVFVGQLPASRIDVFSFAATDIHHDIFAFEVADELIPAGIRTVTVGGVVHFVVLDNVDFHGELPTKQGESLGIIKTVIDAFQ